MGLTLREVREEDLPLLFEQWADPVAVHMAAFTAPDHMDWDAFERRWSRLRADETVLARAIVVDDDVAGTIGSWGEPGEREVTYWIGRSYWGKGIASDALNAFLAVDRSRPLHARVASDNVASRRVLEKCGFRVIATERNVAEARSAEIEELVLRLDELAPTESPRREEHMVTPRQRSAVQGLWMNTPPLRSRPGSEGARSAALRWCCSTH
jgi:RimJ/RimL family protein N-acetyltransferase